MIKTEDNKVPKYKCIDGDGKTLFEYIFSDDIPVEYEVEFNHWMRGQTCPVTDEGRFAIYAYDYERWVRWKTGKTDILIFD
jgi:hypothetical protein